MVPSCEPGPAQGFFLLKGSFSLPLGLSGGQALGFCLCKAPRGNLIVKDYIDNTEMNGIEQKERMRGRCLLRVLPRVPV